MAKTPSMVGLFLCFLMITACGGKAPSRPIYPEITFIHQPKIILDVTAIDVRQEYKKTYNSPHIEHRIPFEPQQIMVRWAKSRLQAVGHQDKILVSIIKASIEEYFPKNAKTASFDYYRAHFEMRVQLQTHDEKKQWASTVSSASGERRVAKSASINEREAAWFELTQETIQKLDIQLEKNIRQYFQAIIVTN